MVIIESLFLDYDNEKGAETDYGSKTLHTLDDKPNKSPPDKYVNKGFSSEIEQQLEELHYYENKINGSLMKKITEFIKENRLLTDINNTSLVELERLKKSFQKAQKDVKIVKQNYEMLQLTNKDLFDKLQIFNKSPKHNDDNHLEVVPSKKRKIVNEKNNTLLSGNYFTIEGLLVI